MCVQLIHRTQVESLQGVVDEATPVAGEGDQRPPRTSQLLAGRDFVFEPAYRARRGGSQAQNGDAEKLLKGMADYVSSQKTLPVSCKDSRCSRTAILVDKGCRTSSLVFLTLSST